jgi:hypothetical protein
MYHGHQDGRLSRGKLFRASYLELLELLQVCPRPRSALLNAFDVPGSKRESTDGITRVWSSAVAANVHTVLDTAHFLDFLDSILQATNTSVAFCLLPTLIHDAN